MAQNHWLDAVRWNDAGLVTAVAQDVRNNEIVMVAHMNREALEQTVATGEAVYWSRSRGRLWHKGEESGHVEKVREIRIDCDADVVLLKVEQVGLACHTGRFSCFYRKLAGDEWIEVDPVIKHPDEIYKKDKLDKK